MRFSIRTLQVPTGKGRGAFAPGLVLGGAPATAGALKTTGAPGTVRVETPRPAGMAAPAPGGAAWQPSSVAPDWSLPSVYVSHATHNLHFPGLLFGDNVLPQPAVSVGRTALQTQHRTRIGGRFTTPAIRAFTRWPAYNGGSTA